MRTNRLLAGVMGLFACWTNPALAWPADGEIPTRIVIGSQASVVERFAAEELRSYLARMTQGEKLPIVSATDDLGANSGCEIVVGMVASNPRLAALCQTAGVKLDEETLGFDGYIIKTVPSGRGSALLLTGRREPSCLFAAYQFLERCGARFFGYRWRDGEIIPRQPALRVASFDIVEKPRMKYRFASDNGYSHADRKKLLNVVDWGVKNRQNVVMLTPSRPGETWQQAALDELKKRGILLAGPGHVLARLTPDQKLFAAHPEYFPLINGRRKTTFSAAWGGCASFCYSNPAAMRIVVDNAVKYAQENPCIDLLAIYPPDGSQHGSQCQCPDCRKLSRSDWYLTLMNHIAEKLAGNKGRDLKLMWISYNECSVPPRKVRPYDHGRQFVLVWCNEIRDLHEPMDSAANRRPSPVLDAKPSLRRIKTDGMAHPADTDLAAWYRWRKWADYLQACDYAGEVSLLEYYNAHVAKSLHVPWLNYCQSGPWPNGIMQQDFQFYVGQKIVGWQNCTDYYNDQPNPYWNRLMAQMLWNPWADTQAIDHDFYDKFYGPAGAVTAKYYAALWREIGTDKVPSNGVARLESLGQQLDDADAIARRAGDTALTARLEVARRFQNRAVEIRKEALAGHAPAGSK